MDTPVVKSSRPYMIRQPVARFFAVGRMHVGGISRTIWGFMSFYNGLEKSPVFASFSGLAPVSSMGELIIDHLPEGVIIVEPGLLYKPIPATDVTGKMMREHHLAMRKWRPKQILSYDKSDAPAVDLGVVHMPGTEIVQ